MSSSQCDPRCEDCGCMHCRCPVPAEAVRHPLPGVPRAHHEGSFGQRLADAQRVAAAASASGERAGWWALVMGAAASIEDAANCLRDPDAKRQAEGAAKHYREAAQALWAQPAAALPAMNNGDPEIAKIVHENLWDLYVEDDRQPAPAA